MKWENAKNISIVAFALLNIALLIIRFSELSLGSERINTITHVLNENGIELASNFRFITPSPKKQIHFSERTLNRHNITPILFINNENIRISQNIFYNDFEKITFTNTGFIYENISAKAPFKNLDHKKAFAENIISSLNINVQLDYARNTPYGFVLAYRAEYFRELIYNNHIIFTFVNGNIHKINFNYLTPISFFGSYRVLRPIDEVLLNFMQIYDADLILSANIVYDLLSYEMAIPFFRIIFKLGGYEKSALISAY
ncbi:MAG: hypothetical protein FWF50_05725 [Defluviitaleaceae bacterium]|nr:hypothetical protein [Defluviitaleaceae bacterium]